jgi:hypothetical protein
MTKQARTQTEARADALFPGFGTTADVESMMTQYTTWLEDMGRVQQESIEFVRARLARDAEAAARLAACKTPTEMLECQLSFTKDAVEDYVRQGQRITSLLMHSGNGRSGRNGQRAA